MPTEHCQLCGMARQCSALSAACVRSLSTTGIRSCAGPALREGAEGATPQECLQAGRRRRVCQQGIASSVAWLTNAQPCVQPLSGDCTAEKRGGQQRIGSCMGRTSSSLLTPGRSLY